MSINLSTAVKTAYGQAFIQALGTAGVLEIYNGSTVLASFALPNPAGTASAGVVTFSGTPLTTTVTTAGTAASARFKAGDGTVVGDSATVGTSGTDIVLNTVTLVQNQNLTINSLTYTPR